MSVLLSLSRTDITTVSPRSLRRELLYYILYFIFYTAVGTVSLPRNNIVNNICHIILLFAGARKKRCFVFLNNLHREGAQWGGERRRISFC